MIRITDLLTVETVKLDLLGTSKEEVLDELIECLDRAGCLRDRAAFREAILAREAQGSTGIGEGIAIPHGKSAAVLRPVIAFGRSRLGVPFGSLDGQDADLFFMIAAAADEHTAHLETLSQLSHLLLNEDFRQSLRTAATAGEVVALVERQQAALSQPEAGSPEQAPVSLEAGLVAVTACPTGVAHTFLAADALKKAASELGIPLKVEANGSGGVQNRLTTDEIAAARAVIVAADRQVEMERFEGKVVVEVPVSEAIYHPTELIQRAWQAKEPVYRTGGGYHETIERTRAERKYRQPAFYRHLMTGVSNMLPLVVGGGILIALSFLFGIKAFDPSDPSYHPLAEALMKIGGGTAFGLMIPIFAGFIAMSIADRPGLAPGLVGGMLAASSGAGFLGGIIAGFVAGYLVEGLKKLFSRLPSSLEGIKPTLLYPLFGILGVGLIMIYIVSDPVAGLNKAMGEWLKGMGTGNAILLGMVLGAMMAFDMGGPVNKAAFTFGIAMIAEGNYLPHAAIMAAGMTPPLGLALATTMFRRRFTPQEREAGKTAYLLGASFITEGAIPFAAADPGRVIPSIMIGSAVAGGLSMAFGCTLPAPHGGIFVLPVVGNWPLYLLAIAVGTVVTALLVRVLKKDATE